MKFNLVGPSYTAESPVAANEELINWYTETLETSGAQTKRVYFATPGLKLFQTLPESPTRGKIPINGREFTVAGTGFYETFSDGTYIKRFTVANDSLAC